MNGKLFYCYHESPIGKLLLLGDGTALHRIHFPNERATPPRGAEKAKDELSEVREQLDEYFLGKRRTFDLKFNLQGTAFQKRVWHLLAEIPYGKTISYGELAKRAGSPKGARAVGAANGKNPLPIVLPCHRVIGKDGSLTGFGGGLSTKTALLKLERENRH